MPESLLPPAGDDPRPRLLIVGCSTRAAAWSAVRAGFRPVCADQFGDEDLRQVAEVVPDALQDFRGGLGNPRVVASANLCLHNILPSRWPVPRTSHEQKRSNERQQLIGPFLGSTTRLREVHQFGIRAHLILYAAGLPALKVLMLPGYERTVLSGRWLVKPFDSGGGRHVRFWNPASDAIPPDRNHYLQEYKPGQPMSAIFLARNYGQRLWIDEFGPRSEHGVELLGLTQQLIGDPVASPPWPFGYCGNIAPVSLPETGRGLILRMGEVITERLQLRGLFGLDFIWDGRTPWVVEVNSRYTASCELLELAYGQPLLTEHWSCFVDEPPPEPPRVLNRRGGLPDVVGKLILYARRAVTAPDLSRFLAPRSPWSVPFLADVPRIGTPFEPGQPMCTVFATGRDADAVRQKLYRRAARVRRWFGDALS